MVECNLPKVEVAGSNPVSCLCFSNGISFQSSLIRLNLSTA